MKDRDVPLWKALVCLVVALASLYFGYGAINSIIEVDSEIAGTTVGIIGVAIFIIFLYAGFVVGGFCRQKTREHREEVERQCRRMIAMHNAAYTDYQIYSRNKDKKIKEFANFARIDTNIIADAYASYFRKHLKVWKGAGNSIPNDIVSYLPKIE